MRKRTGSPHGRTWFAVIGLLTVALALLGGVAIAGGKKPRLNITVPSSVANHASWAIQAQGRSGTFNKLAFFAYSGTTSCLPTEAAEENSGRTASKVSVRKNHRFSVSSSFVAANPGTHTACAYLYKGSAPGGKQLKRTATYAVTP